MSAPRDRHSTSHQTIPDSSRELSSVEARSQPLPQLTIDPVTMRAGSPSKAASSQRTDEYLGQTLEGRYAIEALLGEGGMGFVYLGRHKLIDKRVAIKILRSDLAADAEMTERFINEARAASSIGSPHIVDISDFGKLPDGAAYFAMEFLDGAPLSAIAGNGKVVPIPRLLHIAKQIARGLGVAHTRGVVHRDLKPDNVMLVQRGDDRDFVKILDFGIAKLQGEQAKLTRAGSVFGTPHYMSPEQAAGVPVEHRTDIYSLGVMLYEMATGRVPFDADNFMGILTQHMYKAPAPLRAMALPGFDIPPAVEAIILKAMSKKPELRYGTMEEMILDLEKVERGVVSDAFGEITSRSDLYAVPADYFQGPGSVASTGSSNKLVIYGALGVFAAFVVIGLIVLKPFIFPAAQPQPLTAATTTTPVVAEPGGSAAVEFPATPSPSSGSKKDVQITADPAEATIYLQDSPEDAPLKGPRTFSVGPDEKIKIRIEAPSYVTKHQTVELKGPKHFHLDKEKAGSAAVRPGPVTRPAGPATKPPSPTPSPAPAPAPATGPSKRDCPLEQWDPYENKCDTKKKPH